MIERKYSDWVQCVWQNNNVSMCFMRKKRIKKMSCLLLWLMFCLGKKVATLKSRVKSGGQTEHFSTMNCGHVFFLLLSGEKIVAHFWWLFKRHVCVPSIRLHNAALSTWDQLLASWWPLYTNLLITRTPNSTTVMPGSLMDFPYFTLAGHVSHDSLF